MDDCVRRSRLFYREDIAENWDLLDSLDDLDKAFAKVKEQYPQMYPIAFNYIHKFWLAM